MKVQRVQRVQKVQRVVVAADAADYKKGRGSAAGCVKGLHPTGKTTHYILCVAPLLQNVFAVHRFAQGTFRSPEGAASRLSLLTFQRQSQGNHFHAKNPAAGNCRI